MSYYRSPDDLPGSDAGVDGPVPPGRATTAPTAPATIPVERVVDVATAAEARRARKRAIIIGCVLVDAVILAIVLAVLLR